MTAAFVTQLQHGPLKRSSGGIDGMVLRMKWGCIAVVGAYWVSAIFWGATPAPAADRIDAVARTAVMSAFKPEWTELLAALKNRQDRIINGTDYATGEIEGKPVVLFLSGISMVNAAMTTQFVLDHFTVERIVFSGIAGGLNPDLKIGDVVVPDRWSEYLEAVFARDTGAGYVLPKYVEHPQNNNYGMIFPQPVLIARAPDDPEPRSWFAVDPELFALARTVAASAQLTDCAVDRKCLGHHPKVVIGGNGVSGQAFVDNSDFREYARKNFNADVVDMESAAIAHVAYSNKVPFIVFRSLSDLAGGDAGQNQIEAFKDLASANSASLILAFMKALP
jgi:adenosylhomocysteine nucleosidase